MEIKVLKQYSNGRKLNASGVILTVTGDQQRISWMKDWTQLDTLKSRGLIESICYGSSTWNHVDHFLTVA